MQRLKRKTWNFMFLLLIFCCSSAFAQQKTITGNIKESNGDPVIGASISVKGTTAGTITDIDGNFSLNVPANGKTLVVTYIGFESQELPIDKTNFSIVMTESVTYLDELVVIGYQTVKRRDLTGSVASVSNKDLTATPVSNVAQALQGKLPGVNVFSQDGRPDATISIRVRGGGSISQSNEPLILVDGVEMSLNEIPADLIESIDVLKDASSTAIYGSRGANGVILVTTKKAKEGRVSISYSGFMKFNKPTEYYDVLDPYDYLAHAWGHSEAYNPTMSGAYFARLYGLGTANEALNPGGINAYKDVNPFNLQKNVYNESFSHNHEFSVSGGSENTQAIFSVSHVDEEGLKINSFFKRTSASLKINQKVSKTVEIGVDARFNNMEIMSNEGLTNGRGSLLSAAYRFRPVAINDIKGDLEAMYEGNIGSFAKESQWESRRADKVISDYEPLVTRQRLVARGFFNWNIIDGLSYRSELSLNRRWNKTETWSGAIYNESYSDSRTGEKLLAGDASLYRGDSWVMRWTNTLNYLKTFGKIHQINAVLGHESRDSNGSEMRMVARQFPANFDKETAFAMLTQRPVTPTVLAEDPYRLESFFGRVNYTLMDKYLFTYTFRYDGSSRFAPKNQYATFPGGALAWRISEEAFLQDQEWLDNLKLRVSFGEVGNDGIGPNMWTQRWKALDLNGREQQVVGGIFMPGYTYEEAEYPNPDLKWETTITRDLGIDFSAWNSRLYGTIDLYWNTTKDLLMRSTIAGVTGYPATYANAGQTSNKGVEISFAGDIVRNKDWSLSAGFNINFNKGNIDELAEGINPYSMTQWQSSMLYPQQDYILIEGQPVGLMRGFIYDGFYKPEDFNYNEASQQYTLKDGITDIQTGVITNVHGTTAYKPSGQTAYPGVWKFKDISGPDGTPDGIVNEYDLTVIGDANPAHTGGFNINATWKSFDLGLYFNWSYGNDIYNAHKLNSLYGYKDDGTFVNKLALTKNSYKIFNIDGSGNLVRLHTPAELNAVNQNADLPLLYNENAVVSSIGIEDGSYLRLNTVTLGYTLPVSLTQKVRISSLRIYGSIYNLLTITNYSGLDPEVNLSDHHNDQDYPTPGLDWGAYPRARQFVLGLNLKF